MNDCIFCKIARHEIPADIFYEDEHTVAFLDIKPNVPGHSLVIPKKHAENIFDIDPETLATTVEAARKVAPAILEAVGAKGLHLTSNHGAAAGQVVFHLHFHIIPRHDRSEFEFWPHSDINPSDAKTLAAKIHEALS